jgi:hypothetical protein
MITSVRLVDGPRQMILAPRAGLDLKELSAPFPAVREVAEDRTDGDGTVDTTAFFGARACSIDLLAREAPAAIEDELARFLHPGTRPYLHVVDDEWSQERRLRLRVSQFEGPRGVDLPRTMRRIQAQWKVPDGVWEDSALSTETVNADLPASVGLSFPITFPIAFAATTAVGGAVISNPGGTPSHFVARLYGPCTAPKLINETAGEQISFTSSLVLGAGEYVEIDTRDRTANLLSMSSQSQLGRIDFENTSWWQIQHGDQTVRYAPLSASAGAVAVIEYRPSWL